MFKKIVAVTLAVIILITPMTASAVTWGTVVAQLNASGSYSGEGVEASVSDGAVTVKGSTGATIEGDIDEWHETPAVNIYVGQVDGVNKYSFQDVTFNNDVLMNGDGVGLEVTFGAGTTVNADLVEVGVYDGGTASFTNEGTINAEFGSWGDTGTLSVTNNGTVNGNFGGGFGGTESGPTTGTVINNGTVTGNMNVYAFENATATGIVSESGVVEGTFDGGSRGDATLTNNGAVGSLSSWAEDSGTTKVVNNGTVSRDMYMGASQNSSMTLENSGTVSEGLYAQTNDSASMTLQNSGTFGGDYQVSVWDDSTATLVNNGEVGGEMNVCSSQNGEVTGVNNGTVGGIFAGMMAWDEENEVNIANEGNASTTITNNGTAERYMIAQAWGEGSVTGVNSGDVGRFLVSDAEESGASASVINIGTVTGDTFADAYDGGNAKMNNLGTISGESWTEVYGSGVAQTVNNGTIGGTSYTAAYGSMDTMALSADATATDTSVSAGGLAETVNNGTITEGMESYVTAGGQTSLVNNGSVPSVNATFEVNASGQSGMTAVTGSGTAGELTVQVQAAPDVDVSTAEARKKIADDVASGLSVYAGQLGLTEGNATVKVVIYDEEGNEVGTVETEVPLEPVPKEEEEYVPSEWEIRHEMEEKRKDESLAGVYASPYWCRQMYLGYHSLNFRVFDASGKNVLIRERLSWLDGGPKKNLNLRVRTDETAGLTIRFDEEVLDILERAEIDTITLLTYTEKEAFMQYKTSDLRAAFTKFGLARTDLLVIGGMDDEVMKIGADGKMVPVE